MDPGAVQATFVGQLLLVSVFFLSALLRAHRARTRSPAAHSSESERRASVRRRTSAGERSVTTGSEALAGPHLDEARSAALAEECERLAVKLAGLRAAHAQEEAEFRARRRAALLEMLEHRRVSADLCAEEPQLREHVQRLREEVEHLEHRRVQLASEVEASLEKSAALRVRVVHAKQELATRRLDRERLERRLQSEAEQLRDLAHRRALARAETEELSALLASLQVLTDQTGTLTALSDGELRDGELRDRPALREHDGRSAVVAFPGPKVAAEDPGQRLLTPPSSTTLEEAVSASRRRLHAR